MLHKLTKGLVIKDVWTDYNSAYHAGKDNIKDPRFFKKFRQAVIGKKISGVSRRGKNVLIDLDDRETIVVHMKMTGHLLYGQYRKIRNPKFENRKTWEPEEKEGPLGDPFNQHIHFVVTFSNGKHLALSDMRKFAKVTLVRSVKAHETSHLKNIGPEPLDKNFTYQVFLARLALRPYGKIKQVLMDQSVIAGIGNIYSDEILWATGVHPESAVLKIPAEIRRSGFRLMKEILSKGIDLGGDSMSDYRNPLGLRGKFQYHHKAYRNTGKPCQKKGCRGTIAKIKMNGRHAHFCPKHQKEFAII
jgi:formamidopyrimidine-DNA glycosylase